MADKRPFAKIDTGYILNPKWFQVEQYLRSAMANAMPIALANALRTAREAHLASILYCAQNMTDGVFPVRTIKALTVVTTDEEEAAITALFEVGLWINHPGGMAEVRDYLEHQTAATLAGKRSAAGKAGANARWQKDGKSHAVANGKTNANRNAEEKRREEKLILEDFEIFYSTFPRKAKKPDALKAYKAAIKDGHDPKIILAGAKRVANDPNLPEKQFIPYPASWLRATGWLDDPYPPRELKPGQSLPMPERDQRVKAWRSANGLPPVPESLMRDDPARANAWSRAFLDAIGQGATDQQATTTANQQIGR